MAKFNFQKSKKPRQGECKEEKGTLLNINHLIFPHVDNIVSLPSIGDIAEAVKDGIKKVRNYKRKIFSLLEHGGNAKLQSGDIIGICRGVFDHYGVYINDNSVIHYSSKDSDTSSDNSIIETDLDTFMRGDDTLFKLIFPETYGTPSIAVVNAFYSAQGVFDFPFKKYKYYKLYSPEETIKRARSRLGENKYSLIFNNCEHFAIWCKTGLSESHQINEILECQKQMFEGLIRRRLNI